MYFFFSFNLFYAIILKQIGMFCMSLFCRFVDRNVFYNFECFAVFHRYNFTRDSKFNTTTFLFYFTSTFIRISLSLQSPVFFSRFSASRVRNIWEFGAKNILQTIKHVIQFSYLFLLKRNFLGLFFFWTSLSEEEFPRDKCSHLINEATCFFA